LDIVLFCVGLFYFVVVLFGVLGGGAAGVWYEVTQCRYGAGLVLAILDRNTIQVEKTTPIFR